MHHVPEQQRHTTDEQRLAVDGLSSLRKYAGSLHTGTSIPKTSFGHLTCAARAPGHTFETVDSSDNGGNIRGKHCKYTGSALKLWWASDDPRSVPVAILCTFTGVHRVPASFCLHVWFTGGPNRDRLLEMVDSGGISHMCRAHLGTGEGLVAHADVYDHSLTGPAGWERPGLSPVHLMSLTSDHLPAFLALRLEAIRQHPEAFVPTWEEERAVDPSVTAARFRNDWIADGSFILGAWMQGRLVGAVAIRRWNRFKQRHKATVWLIFTEPGVRRQGVGRYLLDAAIVQCRRDPRIAVLHLSVDCESASARRLYADVGFRSYGVEPKAMRLDDRYVDAELMSLEVDAVRER
jgi:ribosomal protein S18 acetylase RimI-like enzyme